MVGSAHGRPAIAKIAFASEDRVREVIRNFNADGFDSLAPKYTGRRPPSSSASERSEIKKIRARAPDGPRRDLWLLTKLADHLGAKGEVEDMSHKGFRALPREEGLSFQANQDLEDLQTP